MKVAVVMQARTSGTGAHACALPSLPLTFQHEAAERRQQQRQPVRTAVRRHRL